MSPFWILLIVFILIIDLLVQSKRITGGNDVEKKQATINQAIKQARAMVESKKRTEAVPCISVAVSINGKQVWAEGFGIADLENDVPCTSKSVFRIGDVTTAISIVAIAKQWELGTLDLDASVKKLLPNFTAIYDEEEVSISTRQLVTHTSGIRHYNKPKTTIKSISKRDKQDDDDDCTDKEPILEDDTSSTEMMSMDRYGDAKSALASFQDDPLVAEPGSQFLYSTYGWTLASAVLESITNKNITVILPELFKQLNMDNTFLDQYDPVIYNRGGLYSINDEGTLKNSLYVDNSHKWAEGGVLSSVEDLIQFGTLMLYYKQQPITISRDESSTSERKYKTSTKIKYQEENHIIGYLNSSTMETIWTPTNFVLPDGSKYGMGWYVYPEKTNCGQQEYYVARSRVTPGASSVIVVLPSKDYSKTSPPPHGVIVAISANLQGFPVTKTAIQIARIFQQR